MREEIKNLWEQTKKDFEVAEKNFKIKEYYVSAFFCQQSVEKTLKAFFMIKKGKSAGPTHSLIYLAKETKIPSGFFGIFQDLSPEFVTTRYPDVAGDAPYKLYSKGKAQDYLIKSGRLIKWIKQQIK